MGFFILNKEKHTSVKDLHTEHVVIDKKYYSAIGAECGYYAFLVFCEGKALTCYKKMFKN